ncbi:MAG: ATP-dependent helicase HrpB [Kiritimatiellae bacterium]|nr:ATP-dependent helicase HrpB [Kiritimatiellia bacterium]
MTPPLPIFEAEDAILSALRRSPRLAVVAPTGAGKSTEVPQFLLDSGLVDGEIVVLEPRRLAARMLCRRVASERGGAPGGEVGYRVRFESAVSRRTRLVFETEGILLRRLLADRTLSGVGAIVLDEFHERHLYGDLTLSEALRIQRSTRPDLKILAMSATLDLAALRPAFEPFEVVESEGRTFPVAAVHLDRPPDPVRDPPWELAADAYARSVREHGAAETGDALVFMPGAYEISRTLSALRERPEAKGALLLPLHGELDTASQDAAVSPAADGQRKIVVATNVAETSLTIPGIRTVIDSGLARVARFDPFRGINTLHVEKISHASAEQRAGRAGRTAPGWAFRLWTKADHAGRAGHELPEILRVDAAEIVLLLRALGVEDLAAYPWITPPKEKSLAEAEALLVALGALDRSLAVTPLGQEMLSFPVHPRHARMLLEARRRHCVRPVAVAVALAQSRPIWVRGAEKAARERREDVLGEGGGSDILVALRALTYAERNRFDPGRCGKIGVNGAAARAVGPLAAKLVRAALAGQGEEAAGEDADIAKCVLSGFSDFVARRADAGTFRCLLVRGRKGELVHDSAAKDAELLVASEIREIGRTGGETEVRISEATAIDGAWLREMYPDDFGEARVVRWDRETKKVRVAVEMRFRDLALASKEAAPTREEAAEGLAQAVERGDVVLKGWNRAVEQWIERSNLLAAACPEWGIPRYDAEAKALVLRAVCEGAAGAKDVREKEVLPAVKAYLSPAQRGLVEKMLPERVALANGRSAKVQYGGGGDPFIALRIQELYGVKELPKLAGGRVPLVVHILAPNFRPVQITRDLANFWAEQYPKVKKELARKYPKHKWE